MTLLVLLTLAWSPPDGATHPGHAPGRAASALVHTSDRPDRAPDPACSPRDAAEIEVDDPETFEAILPTDAGSSPFTSSIRPDPSSPASLLPPPPSDRSPRLRC